MEPTGEEPRPAVVVREVGPSEIGGSSALPAVAPPPEAAPHPAMVVGVVTPATEFRKKRGRPRKYEGQGRAALSPMPISASIPLSGDYSGWNHSQGRATEPCRKKQKLVFDAPDELLQYTAGSCFTPHMLTVNVGEDVNKKIISFSQQGSTGICVLCATGSISNVTLRQPNSSGGTLTHEGWFDLISLNGSFIVNESSGTKSRSGGMSVALAAPDGRVLGGGLAGMLVAATPVQVIVGTFHHGHQQEQEHEPKPKRLRTEPAVPRSIFTSLPTNIIFGDGFERSYSDQNLNFAPAKPTHGSESKEVNPSQCEVSC